MSILGNRIKKERENLELTREELAQKIGVSYSAIAMYEQGNREPNNELLLKMCEIFNCSIDYLIGKSEIKNIYDEISNEIQTQGRLNVQKLIKNTTQTPISSKTSISPCDLYLSESNPNAIDEKAEMIGTYMTQNNISRLFLCPVYGRISAGQPNWAEECIEGRLPIDPNMMNIVNPEEHFFLRVNGESMNKVIKNGAYALIHKQDVVDDGEIAVVLVNGYEATLKKFTRQGDFVVLEPQSYDDSFKTQIYDKNTPIKILGKYIGKFEMK